MQNNTVQQEEVRGMAVLDHVPEGWKVVDGCTNSPAGYRFINNNKSRFGGEYQHALVSEITRVRKSLTVRHAGRLLIGKGGISNEQE